MFRIQTVFISKLKKSILHRIDTESVQMVFDDIYAFTCLYGSAFVCPGAVVFPKRIKANLRISGKSGVLAA